MRPISRTATALLIVVLCGRVASAQERRQEVVVVTASAAPSEIGEVGRAVSVVGGDDARDFALHSLADLLRLAPHLRVASRGEEGVQADFSLRGATFGQTLVMVDGVRINDPQTGHHNGDIPVPLDDVERVEILYGPASSLHGADAFGGTINVITRRERSRAALRLAGGSFGFVDGSASGRLGGGTTRAAITLGGKRSDGFTADRDFEVLEGRADLFLGTRTRATVSTLDKEFGAAGFYGPAPSREWTSQTLASVDRSFAVGDRTAGTARAWTRFHDDHFVYDVTRPALSDNRHESGSAGFSIDAHRRVGERGRLSLGTEGGAEWIDSSNLGRDGYGRVAVFGELQQRLGAITLTPGVRVAAHEGFAPDASPSLAVAGPLGGSARWRASLAHAFRVPTWTERLYRDPNHEARDDLQPEEAWGADAGLDLGTRSGWSGSLSVFARRDDSVIDWVRPTPDERWHTANVRDVRTYGVEVAVDRRLGEGAHVGVDYAWLDSRADELDLLSKYLLDFARHQAGVRLRVEAPGAVEVGIDAVYRRHADGRDAGLLDLRVSKRLGAVLLYADARNLLDSRTPEIVGVEAPGRAFAAGIRAALP